MTTRICMVYAGLNSFGTTWPGPRTGPGGVNGAVLDSAGMGPEQHRTGSMTLRISHGQVWLDALGIA